MLQLPQEKQVAILDRWRELILSSYPAEAAAFFGRQKDRFANPVGEAVRRHSAVLLDGILADTPPHDPAIAEALDGLVRIRAVQDFTPAQAVAFVFQLKQALREALPEGGGAPVELELRVDRLALAAFDHYARCREQIFDVKIREIRNRTAKLFARAGLLFEESVMNFDNDQGGNGSSGKGAVR